MKYAKDNVFYQMAFERNLGFLKNTEKKLKDFPPKEKWEIRPPQNVSIESVYRGLKFSLFGLRLNNLIASYSKGDDKNELKKQFSEAVLVMEKVWDKKLTKVYHGIKQEELNQYKFDTYLYMLQMFSFAVLLDVNKDEFMILVNLIDRDKVKDFLFEFIISSRVKDRKPIQEESYKRYLLVPKLYGKLVAIANDNDLLTAQKGIQQFLMKDWIKIPKNHFIDFNLKDIESYTVNSGFVGLWAFEVAAVVKIKGLDDSSFRDDKFYPDRLLLS